MTPPDDVHVAHPVIDHDVAAAARGWTLQTRRSITCHHVHRLTYAAQVGLNQWLPRAVLRGVRGSGRPRPTVSMYPSTATTTNNKQTMNKVSKKERNERTSSQWVSECVGGWVSEYGLTSPSTHRSFQWRVFPVNHLHWYGQPNKNNQATEHTNNIKITQPKKESLVNSTTHNHKKPRISNRTDIAWFSRLVRHPARKRSGSILTTRGALTGPAITQQYGFRVFYVLLTYAMLLSNRPGHSSQ